MIDSIQAHQRAEKFLWLGLSPEGTRKYTEGWRSGFYQLAFGAQVPLAIVQLDYGQKVLKFVGFMYLSGNVESDYQQIDAMYQGVKGFNASQAAPIRPLPARESPK